MQEDANFKTINTDNIKSNGDNEGVIIGSVVRIVFLVVITFRLYYFFKKNNKKKA